MLNQKTIDIITDMGYNISFTNEDEMNKEIQGVLKGVLSDYRGLERECGRLKSELTQKKKLFSKTVREKESLQSEIKKLKSRVRPVMSLDKDYVEDELDKLRYWIERVDILEKLLRDRDLTIEYYENKLKGA